MEHNTMQHTGLTIRTINIIGLDWHDIKLDTQPNMQQILQWCIMYHVI